MQKERHTDRKIGRQTNRQARDKVAKCFFNPCFKAPWRQELENERAQSGKSLTLVEKSKILLIMFFSSDIHRRGFFFWVFNKRHSHWASKRDL
jgi:hypothetical protein